ncbi:ribulose bisphosphate carboxylase small subunit [Acaryochloris sp. IP29b_bin.137]|uniref:ribulose bisphosphate carboxylase small subunit n=1 Tax=Acaryochloris sp. IP29b_bin.137 TaxID=2969217 RepID=UPI00262D2020|nr:ribulose bisphosphate carboxylase small subunit [Acaryochloris sp. IP29b_bin.137]
MRTLPIEQRFETFSYLPPLNDDQIRRQIQYILDQGYIAGIEFNDSPAPTEYYWTMWKLPLFKNPSVQDVLYEIGECRSEYSDKYIRVVGFDNIRQCQVMSFIVHKPGNNSGYRPY